MYPRFFTLLLLLVLGNTSLIAQIVNGKLVNNKKTPMAYATVTLLRADSSVAGGALTDDAGAFSITPIPAGSYTMRISGIGFTTVNRPGIAVQDGGTVNVGTITIVMSSQSLQEVSVAGERPLMELSVDKKVFNVEKNITTAGGSAADVLQNVPSVSVDADGSVSLRGKSNVTILIDGKPSTLFGGDPASALASLPAASVESVEVITNPSAKYDAQGMGGIINIVTKRNKKLGLNGSATLGVGTRDKYNGTLNLNLRNNKWNIFLNSSFRQNRNINTNTTTRTNAFNDSAYRSEETGLRMFSGFFNTLGAEYTINEKNSITLTENVNIMQWGGRGTTNYMTYNRQNEGQQYALQRRENDNSGGPFSISSSLDYKRKFTKQREELTANLTYAYTIVQREQEYITNDYDGSGNLLYGPILQYATGGGHTSSMNGQIDHTMPFFTTNGKLDAGLKSQLFWFRSQNDAMRTDPNGGETVDSLLLNGYNYSQFTYAAYTSFSDQQGKWSYQAGLRLEYSIYEGSTIQLGNKRYTNEFLNLFPSVFTSYKIADDQSIYLSYTRRINRPHFFQLMPYVDLSNPQDTSMGNPDLKPEFINNLELNYSKQFKKGHMFIVSAYYQYTQNLIERYRLFYADGTTFSQPRNLNAGITYGAELTGRLQLTKFWDATLNANFFYNEVQGTNIDPLLNNSGASWLGKINTNFKLPAGFSLQLNGNYEAPKTIAQGQLQEVGWLDAAIRKNLWNNKATLVLNVSDIFNTRKYTTEYAYPSYTQITYRDRETRIGNISFTYRFGADTRQPQGAATAPQQRRPRQQPQTQPGKERENLKSDESGEGGGR